MHANMPRTLSCFYLVFLPRSLPFSFIPFSLYHPVSVVHMLSHLTLPSHLPSHRSSLPPHHSQYPTISRIDIKVESVSCINFFCNSILGCTRSLSSIMFPPPFLFLLTLYICCASCTRYLGIRIFCQHRVRSLVSLFISIS